MIRSGGSLLMVLALSNNRFIQQLFPEEVGPAKIMVNGCCKTTCCGGGDWRRRLTVVVVVMVAARWKRIIALWILFILMFIFVMSQHDISSRKLEITFWTTVRFHPIISRDKV
jgi:hypothetical protein